MRGSDFLSIAATPEFSGALSNRAFLISLAFPDSRTKRFGLGLELAKQAALYEQRDIGGTGWHFSAFGRDEDQMRKASMAMDCLSPVKGLMIFVNGISARWSTPFRDTLRCYLRACVANRQDDWCHLRRNNKPPEVRVFEIRLPGQIGVQPPARKVLYWVVPCQRLGSQSEHATSMSVERFREVLVAEAGRREADWCPFFSPQSATVTEVWE